VSSHNLSERRVLITGVSRYLGLRLAKRLATEGVESLVGVDLEEPEDSIPGLDFIRADICSPLIARVVDTTRVDTIVHTNISSRSGRWGNRSHMKESNVVGTMQLLAAAQRSRRVTRVVVKSSAAVYGSLPGEPSLVTEQHSARTPELSGYGRDCAEAETFARDFGRRRPDVQLIILRTQNVIGPTVDTSIARYLSLPVVPIALGFDPRVQLLHEDDAVTALHTALVTDERGIFNIAGDGTIYLSQAVRALGRVPMPLLLPVAHGVALALRRGGVIDFPVDQLPVLLYGRVLDTRRAKELLGYAPTWSTAAALDDFKNNRAAEQIVATKPHTAWERELAGFLRSASSVEAKP
jgi:UDP-glucose 4-epimerase